jgi:hypothetical protein
VSEFSDSLLIDHADDPSTPDDPVPVQVKINEECQQLFDKMKSPLTSIPPSLMLLICIIQKLTDTPSSLVDCGELKEPSAAPDSSSLTESPQSGCAHQDIFYASSCAALFLRLICPAIISPLEWGALRVPAPFQRPTPQPATTTATATVPHREAARTVMFGKGFSSSEMNFASKPTNRQSFVPSLLFKRSDSVMTQSPHQHQSTPTQFQPPTDEELKSINAMDQNPAVAAVILVAHLLSSTEMNFVQEKDQRRELSHLIGTVVRTVPLQKLEVYLQRYEEKTRSLVDPSTQAAFESPQTKRALLIFARSVQKIANLSIVDHQLVEVPPPSFIHLTLSLSSFLSRSIMPLTPWYDRVSQEGIAHE